MALLIIALKEFVMPVVMVLLGSLIHQQTGIWIGLALGPAAAFGVSMLVAYLRYGKDAFPWLIPRDQDDRVWCYDFEITEKNVTTLSETIVNLLLGQGYSQRTSNLAGMLTEDIFILVKEKNPEGKAINAECNVIFEDTGVRLIYRDSGIIFSIVDNEDVGSLRSYVVSRVVCLPEHKMYLTTTGYNRNEIWLEKS